MIRNLKKYFERALERTDQQTGTEERRHAIQVATTALLVEMAGADYGDEHLELSVITTLLGQHFELTAEEGAALLALGQKRADRAVSLHEFTRMLHEHLSHEEKLRIVEMLWRVAYADDQVHRYEDHLVRKVADLLYVRHSDFVRLKHKVAESQ